jgi:hypothetical protein
MLPASGKQLSAISVLNLIGPQPDAAPVAGDDTLDRNDIPRYKPDYLATRENRNESPKAACG